MKLNKTEISPEIYYGKLSMIPGLIPILREAPHIKRVEQIGVRQFYDKVYRVRLLFGNQLVAEEVVRRFEEDFLDFVRELGNVSTREELLSLDQRTQVYYD